MSEKRKPGPPKRLDTVKKTVMLTSAIADWAKAQPEGLSGLVRECLEETRKRRTPQPAMTTETRPPYNPADTPPTE